MFHIFFIKEDYGAPLWTKVKKNIENKITIFTLKSPLFKSKVNSNIDFQFKCLKNVIKH